MLYDEPGTGKSMAGIAVLEDYYLLKGNKFIKGIMVSTEASDGLYVKVLAEFLQTSRVDGVQISTDGASSRQKVLGSGLTALYDQAADSEIATNGDLDAGVGITEGNGVYQTIVHAKLV